MKNNLTLIIPEFFLETDSNLIKSWKNLNLLLARATVSSIEHDVENFVYSSFNNFDKNSLAALLLTQLGVELSDEWVSFAVPVNIQPNRNYLTIVNGNIIDLSKEEGDSFVNELNLYFKEEGYKFYNYDNQRWIVTSTHALQSPEAKAADIVEQDIALYMPDVLSKSKLKNVFSDIQLMLHHSKTNMFRSQNGKMEINSLWINGEGKKPENITTPLTNIYTDCNNLSALSSLVGLSVNQSEINASDSIKGNTLVYYPYGNFIDKFDDETFHQIFLEIKQGNINELTLITDNKIFSVTQSNLKKFWKRQFNL